MPCWLSGSGEKAGGASIDPPPEEPMLICSILQASRLVM